MANRFWVGGTASWNGTAGSKWSTTSGGTGGAAEPTSSDDVFLDANSGAVTITLATTTAICKSLDCTGFSGVLTGATNIDIYGSLTFNSTMVMTISGNFSFKATTGTSVITSAGQSIAGSFNMVGAGGSWQLADNLSVGVGTGSSLVLDSGTFDANGKNVTCDNFVASGTTTRTLTMGSGTWTITGLGTVWNITTKTNLTFTSNTSTIKFTDSSITIKEFYGGNLTYYNFWNNTSNAGCRFNDSNTFNNITIDAGASQIFGSGLTTTFTTLTAVGSSGAHISLVWDGSITNVSCASGIINVYYCDITGIHAGGGATFNAINSTDNGNNTGWIFSTVVNTGNMFLSII